MRWMRIAVTMVVVALAGPAVAAETGLLSLLPAPSITRHSLAVVDRPLDYQSEAGTLALKDGTGETTAAVFYVGHHVTGADRDRPITFVFNGGPGAASAYLNLGALGPKLLATAPGGGFLPPPQRLADNPDSWLAFTDLVFVDPPGTGFSRAAAADKEERYYGVAQDATAMAAFVRLYLQKVERVGAPIYLAGESYGGFRAALLAKVMPDEVGLSPSGIILISPALEFALLRGDDWNPLTYALDLPGLSAVHLEASGVRDAAGLAAGVAEAEAYALGDYLTALAGGVESGGRQASETVARLTGLPLATVERRFGRVSVSDFVKDYRPGRLLSRYDGSVDGPDPDPASSYAGGPDAVLDRSVPALTEAFLRHVREDLGFRTDITYRLLNGDVNRRWDFGTSATRQGYAGVLGDLHEARALNPALKVLVAHGYTDLVTPYFATAYLLRQLPALDGAVPIVSRVYPGGHMMYLRPDSRRALRDDAAALYGPAPTTAPATAPADGKPAPVPL